MEDKEIVLIELELAFAIKTFQEAENVIKTSKETQKAIQDYILKFCLKHNLPLDETLEKLNPLLPYGRPIEKKYIIPENEQEQDELIQEFLYVHLNNSNIPFGDMEKAKPVIANFCNITGIDSEFATTSILNKTRLLQKDFIENIIYKQILECQHTSTNMEEFVKNSREIICVLSDEINSPRKYTISLLKEKFKKQISQESANKDSSSTHQSESLPQIFPEDDAR